MKCKTLKLFIMRKKIFFILSIVFFVSCKEDLKIDEKTNEKTSNQAVNIQSLLNAYEGMGTYDALGHATYHVKLPKSQKLNINLKDIYSINGSVIFIRIENNSNASMQDTGEVLKWNFNIPNFNRNSPQSGYRVYVYHDNSEISIERAEQLVNNGCDQKSDSTSVRKKSSNLDIPERCGNGVLTLE